MTSEPEEYKEDLFRIMDQGKSSHASSVESWVTLHEIADRSDTAIRAPHGIIRDQPAPLELTKTPHEPDKSAKMKTTLG
jgi:hypothetical protein